MLSLKRQRDSQVGRWINKLGSIEYTLQQLLKVLLKNSEEWFLKDFIPQCIRIENYNVYYCYDSWMRDTRNIAKNYPQQLENYYFSQQDLNEIRQHRQNFSNQKKSLLFRIMLYLLNIGTSQLKLRNYQVGSFLIKWVNLQQRVFHFKQKYNQNGLGSLFQSYFNNNSITAVDILSSITKKHKQPKSQKNSVRKENSVPRTIVSSHTHTHQDFYEGNPISYTSKVLSQVQNIDYKKMKFTTSKQKQYKQQRSQDMNLNMKRKLTQNQPQVSMKLYKYLELDQYVPHTQYQKNVIKFTQSIYIKPSWQRKIYLNGSVYFGEIVKDERHGEGLYLFESDDLFYGSWERNIIDGCGIYIFKSGECYEGQLKNGAKHGHGTYTYNDGRVYDGFWLNNAKKGLGTLTFPDGVVFMGVFGVSSHTQGLFVNQSTGKKWNGTLQHYLKTMKEKSKCQPQLNICKNQQIKIVQEQQQIHSLKKNGYDVVRLNAELYQGSLKDDLFNGFGTLHAQGQHNFSISGQWKNGILFQYKPQIQPYEGFRQ